MSRPPQGSATGGPPRIIPHVPESYQHLRRINVVLHVTLPTRGFKDIDRVEDLPVIFKQIEKEYDVMVATDEVGGGVTIWAGTKMMAADAQDALRNTFKTRPRDKNMWHPSVVVDPRCPAVPIAFYRKPGPNMGARPIVSPNREDCKDLDGELSLEEYEEEFQTQLRDIFNNLRWAPNEMRMRVNYGALCLEEWKKGEEATPMEQFSKSIRRVGVRGTCHLDKLIGNKDTTDRLLSSIRADGNRFGPPNARIAQVEDVPPAHWLILHMKGVTVEAQILTMRSYEGHKYRLGSLSTYRREKRSRALEMTTSSPHMTFDWCLEIQNKAEAEEIPFTLAQLQSCVRFSGEVQALVFPSIQIASTFTSKYGVESVLGKTTWSYNVDNSPYNIVVGLYRKWGADTTKEPEVGAGMELHGTDWDDLMPAHNIARSGARPWVDDLSEFLPKDYALGKDGFDAFLHHVREMQAWLSSGIPKDSQEPGLDGVKLDLSRG